MAEEERTNDLEERINALERVESENAMLIENLCDALVLAYTYIADNMFHQIPLIRELTHVEPEMGRLHDGIDKLIGVGRRLGDKRQGSSTFGEGLRDIDEISSIISEFARIRSTTIQNGDPCYESEK